ncbi:MAG: transporter substrate-binding domain-containing protein [Alphaproteobacteria bacterium]|nr:transporter substrate-binding domain-containing protein [Alphaproteobacteria bacterium]
MQTIQRPKILSFLLLLTVFLALTKTVSAEVTLKLVNDPWPPYTGMNLPGKGVATEIVVTALNKAGYKTSMHFAPWARALEGTISGTYDILLTTSFTKERAKVVAYSEPYLGNVIRFIKLESKAYHFDQLDDLHHLNIGVVRGYVYEPMFDKSELIYKIENTLLENNLRMLLAGRLDLVVEDELVAQKTISKLFPDEKYNFSFLSKPLNKKPMHIIIRKAHPSHVTIISRFNAVLDTMRADGTYDEILAKHGFSVKN